MQTYFFGGLWERSLDNFSYKKVLLADCASVVRELSQKTRRWYIVFCGPWRAPHTHYMGVGRGVAGCLAPLDFENFSKKSCFVNFEWEKTSFSTFPPPGKIPWLPPLEKIFPAPMTHYWSISERRAFYFIG